MNKSGAAAGAALTFILGSGMGASPANAEVSHEMSFEMACPTVIIDNTQGYSEEVPTCVSPMASEAQSPSPDMISPMAETHNKAGDYVWPVGIVAGEVALGAIGFVLWRKRNEPTRATLRDKLQMWRTAKDVEQVPDDDLWAAFDEVHNKPKE